MDDFDVEGARAAGYTDAEIADYLAREADFDIAAARAAGYNDEEIVQHLRPIRVTPSKPEPDRSLDQNLGVVTSALSPYLTVAGLGAAAGAPFAGVGAIPGAAGGVLSLGLADLGTGAYNLAAPMFGGSRVPLPSETIRAGYESVGIGSRPQTPEQEVLFRTVEGGAGALSGASALGTLATRQAPGLTRNIMQQLAQQKRAQTAAGAGAGAAPTIASEYGGVTNPLALYGLSMAGGMGAGALATPRPQLVTSEQLRAQAKSAYDASEQAGVRVSAQAMRDLDAQIDSLLANANHNLKLHPLTKEVRKMFSDVANDEMSFEMLEDFRRAVRDYPYSQGGGARGTKTERAIVGQMSDAINDFMMNLKPTQITGGNAFDAAFYLNNARIAARKNFEADLVENTVDKALKKESGSAATNLRTAFGRIADNANRMARLTPETQKNIESLAKGTGFRAFERAGKYAPRINVQNLTALMTGGAGATYLGQPVLGAVPAVLGTGMIGLRAIANQMAKSRANAMGATIRGTPQRQVPVPQIAAQSATNLPDVDLPDVAPEGQVLLGYGTGPSGEQYPIYGYRAGRFATGEPFYVDEQGNYIGPRR